MINWSRSDLVSLSKNVWGFMLVSQLLSRPCGIWTYLTVTHQAAGLKVLSLFSYLQVEWEVRRKSPRLFTSDTMKSFNCRVPQQDNSSDCGLYLLQYVESFLQVNTHKHTGVNIFNKILTKDIENKRVINCVKHVKNVFNYLENNKL